MLDGLELYEPIDVNLLYKCINSTLLREYTDKKWFATEKQQLENYANLITRNFAKVKYHRKEGYTFGRVNPDKSLGLHSIRKETRHTLIQHNMVDVDIENAHNVMLVQILKHNHYDKDYSHLKDYVQNRQAGIHYITTK